MRSCSWSYSLARKIAALKNKTAREVFEQAMAELDVILADAPVKPERVPADRNMAANKAHLTRTQRKLKGTRGKARVAILEKIAAFEQRLAA